MIPQGNNNRISGGFPHSEIHGSKPIPGSPWLIAGYHVLHRLLLPRHPPNALIALDLTRKKKDPHPCGVRPLRGHPLSRSACNYSRLLPQKKTWLVYLTWTTPPLVLRPPHPHSGAADNADNLSERCERSGFPAARVRLDGKAQPLSDQVEEVMVEPDGIEPTTSCLQSRRSTS